MHLHSLKSGIGIVLFSIAFLLPLDGVQSAPEKITLTVWEFSANEAFLARLLERFETEHPHIQVRIQQLSWEHGLEKIIIAMAAGNPPDVAELGIDWVAKFIHAGLLKEVTQETSPLREHYHLWESVSSDGKVYGFPWLVGTRLLFYNKELFRNAGLNPNFPPRTWSELLQAARQIHQPEKGIYGFSIFAGEPYSPWQEFLPFAWGNGAILSTEDPHRILLDQPAVLEALSFYRQLKPFSLVERQGQVNTLFAEGKVGMQISGAWNLRLIPRLNPELRFQTALLPKPDKAGTAAAFAGGEVLALLKSSPHPEESLQLIRFLIEESQTMEVVKHHQNVLPAFKKSVEDPYFQSQHHPRRFLEQMATAVSPPTHPLWPELQAFITRAVEEVMIGNTPPEKALRNAQVSIDRLLAEEAKRPLFRDQLLTGILWAGCFLIFVSVLWIRKKREGFVRPAIERSFSTFIFLSPWLLTFALFGLYPLLHSVVMSFSRYPLLTGESRFLGFQNYVDLLKSADFHRALGHTLFFAAGTIPPTLALALGAAVLIHRKIPFKQLYQAGLFLPVVTSVIVIATLFTYLYSPTGPINMLLDKAGLPKPVPSWLVHPRLALPSIMMMNIWASFGYYMILFLAGLNTIPENLYEAAAIDGASEWQKFRRITLPQLRPIILFVVVIHTIHSLQVFPEVLTMTQGGPLGATKTVVYHLYETGFQKFEMGLASAVGYLLFIITLLLSLAQMRIFGIGEETSE